MNYGCFLKKLKKYCINRKITNETLVNIPIKQIITTAKIKKEKGGFKGDLLFYEITESSRIINNKLDISPKIKEALNLPGMEEKLTVSFNQFYEKNIDKSKTGDMIDDYLTSIESDSTFTKKEISNIKSFSNEPDIFLTKILIRSLKESNFLENADISVLWCNGDNYVKVIEGDIFNYALGKRLKKPRIVVIPVNTAFDTHVSNKLEGTSIPVVSNTTLHGQFLLRVYKSGSTEFDIRNRIINDLAANGLIKDSTEKIALPIGSIATLDINSATIYLLAVSEFDKYNNAHSSEETIKTSILCLLNHYDRKGQGYEIYIPLIGTGMSRARLTHQQSYNLIVDTLLLNKSILQGKINIVIQREVMKTLNINRGG